MTTSERENRPDDKLDLIQLSAGYEAAMALARRSERYFKTRARIDRIRLDNPARAAFAVECMRVTCRLSQVISWYLVRKAVAAGEMSIDEAFAPNNRLGNKDVCLFRDVEVLSWLPHQLTQLLEQSMQLYRDVLHLDCVLQTQHLVMRKKHPMRRLEDSVRAGLLAN